MKLAKMLGLAAVAALVIAAIGGTGTASATVLCKVHPEKVVQEGVTVDVCPEAQVYGEGEQTQVNLDLKAGTTSDFTSQDQLLTFVECTKAEIDGKITQAQQVEGQVERAVFEQTEEVKCAAPAIADVEKVEVEVKNLPYKASAVYEGQQEGQGEKGNEVGAGKVISEESPEQGGPIQFEFKQGAAIACQYELKPAMEGKVQGKAINGEAGPEQDQTSQVVFDGEQAQFELKEAGLGCPESGKFVATFDVKGEQNGEPIDIYIAKEKV